MVDSVVHSAGAGRLVKLLQISTDRLLSSSNTLNLCEDRHRHKLSDLQQDLRDELRSWQSSISKQTEFLVGCQYAISQGLADVLVPAKQPPQHAAFDGKEHEERTADPLMGLLSEDGSDSDEDCRWSQSRQANMVDPVDHFPSPSSTDQEKGTIDANSTCSRKEDEALKSAESAAAVRSKFAAFDLDDNSLLDRHEVANLLTMLRIAKQSAAHGGGAGPIKMPTAAEIDRALAKMDADGDGLVTLAEFEAWHDRHEQRNHKRNVRTRARKARTERREGSPGQEKANRDDSIDRTKELCDRMVQGMPVFKGMLAAERRRMVEVLEPCSFGAGEQIIKQGDPGDAMYILGAGEALARLDVGGECFDVKTYSRGDYFGEVALLSDAPRAASVLAKTACTCLRISALGFKTTIGPSTLERMKVEAERMLARRADIVNEHGVRQSQAEEASRQNERTAQWVKQNREGGLPQVQWDRRTQRYVRAIPNNRASEVWSAAKTTPVAPTFQSAASSEMIDSANGNVAEGSVSAAPTLAPANSNAAPHSQQVELVLENG